MASYSIIVLAAGASTRLGQPKQLLPYKGKTLITHIAETALATGYTPVVIVLGANAHLIRPELVNMPVHIVQNEHWEEGMASSIHCGLSAILKIAPAIDGIICTVCDQPFISSALLKNLIDKHIQTGKGIIASAYDTTLGTPVFFAKEFFTELLQLKGKEGAKKLIAHYQNSVETCSFAFGSIDIDTASDYTALQQ